MLDDQLLSMADIARLEGVSRATITAWRQQGLMPPPDGIFGLDSPRWLRDTIATWRADRERAAGVKDA